jgi:hypothetical protein
MNNSLQQYGIREVQKQLRLRMKNSGLDSIRVEVTRKSGKLKFDFLGSPDQVTKAYELVANWD